MERVLLRDLEYPGDGLYYFNGEPFTGIAYSLTKEGWEKSQAEYREGLRWGPAKEWYGPDKPMVDSYSFKGVLHGRAREWHKNGILAEDGEYEYGITLWEKNWDEEGILKKDYKLKESDNDYQTLQRYRAIYKNNP